MVHKSFVKATDIEPLAVQYLSAPTNKQTNKQTNKHSMPSCSAIYPWGLLTLLTDTSGDRKTGL